MRVSDFINLNLLPSNKFDSKVARHPQWINHQAQYKNLLHDLLYLFLAKIQER